MFYRSKLIAAASVALFAATGAQAVTLTDPLGTLATPQTFVLSGITSPTIPVGAFTVDISFTTTVADLFSSVLTYTVAGATSGLFPGSFAANIDGHNFVASVGPGKKGALNGITNTLTFSASNNLSLPIGVHHIYVSGTALKGSSLAGSLNLVAAPVPEPETYALMLAGLGAVGLLSARRRQS